MIELVDANPIAETDEPTDVTALPAVFYEYFKIEAAAAAEKEAA